MLVGQQIKIFGWFNLIKLRESTLFKKILIISQVTSKSAITPSFKGRINSMLLFVRPIIE